MKTQYYTASTLDKFIATEDDSIEWLFPLADPSETSYFSFIEGVGVLAMGSRGAAIRSRAGMQLSQRPT